MSRGRSLRTLMLVGLIGPTASASAIDSDLDGVADDVDVCCNTPSGVEVDAEGRPVGDFNVDCVIDLADHTLLHMDLGGPGSGMADLQSFADFQVNFTGTFNAVGVCCAAPLDPVDDETNLPPGGIPDIIVSEIKPGEYIEVFNATAVDVDLSAVAWQWCVAFLYQAVATAVTVPAGGYATLAWPSTLTNPTEPNGEVILFKDSFFISNSSVLDFVCWGSPSPSRRLTQGAGSGKWGGLCAPSIPAGGAIHRRIGTSGNAADSYDVTSPPSPMTCVP